MTDSTPIVRDLNWTAKGVYGAATFDDALHVLANQARVVVGAHQSAISYIPNKDFKRAIHTHSFSTKYENYNTYDVMPTGDGIWGLIVGRDIAVRMTQEEVEAHPLWKNFSDLLDDRGLEHPPMRGWLAVPILRQNGENIGVLQLSDKYDDAEFTADDQELLTNIANVIVPTFELQYVNQELQSRTRELEESRLAAVNMMQDIARAREDLAEQAELLKRSNADLEQFASVASHDLQEPLRAVSGYCQILQRNFADDLDPKAVGYINSAVEGAQRMQQLIDDLLTYSRIGREGTDLQLIDYNEVVEQAITRLKAPIEESNAAVDVGDLPMVKVESRQHVQLIQNLISNAIKYRGDDPPRIAISAETRDNDWVFTVCDNGIGIEPQFFERIFTIFQRLHTREEYSGTGIGLALCKRIVDRHNGRIWVESEPGKGSGFHFTVSKNSK